MKNAVLIVGIVTTLIGLLWIGQGLGYINWPASSLMIAQKQWAFYGACLGVLGLFLIGFSRARQ